MKKAIQDVYVWLPRTETWLYSEITALGAGWQAWVVAHKTENAAEFPYPRVFSLLDAAGRMRWAVEMVLRRARLTSHAPSIARFCASLEADLLHSHFGTIGWFNLRLARKLGVPHVVTFYGSDVTIVQRRERWRRRYREMFDEVSLVLCEGPHMASEIARLGCDPDKISVHRLGVRLADLPCAARARRRPLRFLMAGRYREKKGLVDGLRALCNLSRSRPQEDWRLTIVGGPGNCSEGARIAGELRETAMRYKLADRISFSGILSHAELIAQAQRHDVFLCPSVTSSNGDTEGGAPVVMIEMAAMGLPVIGTRHCDMPQALGAKNRALLVGERDPDALTRSIEWLLDHPDSWSEISADNRSHCETHFDHVEQGERLARLYDRVTAGA